MKNEHRKWTRFFKFFPPQRYFLMLQLCIFLTTLVFVLSIILTNITQAMESSYALVGGSEKLNLIFDAMMQLFFIKISLLFAAVFLINILLGFFFLERLTGPLVRIQHVLEEIGSGRIPDTDVYLRKHDFPVELGNALSSAVAFLRRKKAGL